MNASAWQILLVQLVVAAGAALGIACELFRQAVRALDEARRVRAETDAMRGGTDFDAAVSQAVELVNAP